VSDDWRLQVDVDHPDSLLDSLDARELELKHWHPEADEWEDPDKPLPADAAAKLAEHEELIAAERKRVEKTGEPEYEVRVDLPSRHEAERFCEQLKAEGLPAIHRWRFLLIGVTDEDTAKVLAERLRAEAPAGSTVKVEGTWKAIVGELPSNPFALLGGLGE
jgi:hypothetical protein